MGIAAIIGIGSLVAISLWVTLGRTVDSTSSNSSHSGVAHLKLVCVCAKHYEDIYPVVNAYRENDGTALYGLISRGKAMELEKDTTVTVVSDDSGIAFVLVKSGFQSGESCYVPSNFVDVNNY